MTKWSASSAWPSLWYTAYDTQMIKRYHAATLTDPDMAHKGAILCALQLYLDFINMFLYILRLVARKK